MAAAKVRAMGPTVTPPSPAANWSLPGIEVFVDLAGVIDVAAERQKNEKERQRIRGLIEGKEKKLSNESFRSRAPADVVQKEQDALAELRQQLQSVETFLRQLDGKHA